MRVENFERGKVLEEMMNAAKTEVLAKITPEFYLNTFYNIKNTSEINSTEYRLAEKYIDMFENFKVVDRMLAQIEQDYLDAMEEL